MSEELYGPLMMICVTKVMCCVVAVGQRSQMLSALPHGHMTLSTVMLSFLCSPCCCVDVQTVSMWWEQIYLWRSNLDGLVVMPGTTTCFQCVLSLVEWGLNERTVIRLPCRSSCTDAVEVSQVSGEVRLWFLTLLLSTNSIKMCPNRLYN